MTIEILQNVTVVEVITETVTPTEVFQEAEVIVQPETQTVVFDFAGSDADPPDLAQRCNVVSPTLVYRAEAAKGSEDGQPVWRIRKITITVDGDQISTDTVWAEGSKSFVHQWSEHTSYTYS